MSYRTNRRTRGVFRLGRHSEDEMQKAREFLAERAVHAVSKGAKYLRENPKATGFTILHDDATGSVYDIDRPQDLVTLHNVLPREDLFIVARDNNRELTEALATALTTPYELVDTFGASPGYRVTTTGGYHDASGQLFIDHGFLAAIPLDEALSLGRQWKQQSILELDNRGESLEVRFHNV